MFSSFRVKRGVPTRPKWNEEEVFFPNLDQSASVDTLWMTGFLHHEKRRKEKKKKVNPPRLTKEVITKEEYKHMEVITKNLAAAISGSKKKKSPYYLTNTRLKKVDQMKQRGHNKVHMRSRLLENYLELNRNEIEAAISLQCFWRRIIARRYLRRLSIEKMAATIIQAAVRSMLLRCWLRNWIRKRSHYIIFCQSHLRRRLAHRRWEERKKLEYNSASCIQSHIRMYLAKCQLDFIKRSNSVTIIASYFRGYQARKMYKIKWKTSHVIKIQTHFRIQLCQRVYEKVRTQKHGAAKDIQRYWRGYVSRKLVSNSLHKRYNSSFHMQVQLFDADIDYYTGLMTHSIASGNVSLEKIHAYECTICESESKLKEWQLMYAQLTPKSIRQGWKEQLERNIKSERATLTKMKMKAIFVEHKEFLTEKIQAEQNEQSQQELTNILNSTKKWKIDLAAAMLREKRTKDRLENEVKRRQAIADEKRKWAVQHTVLSGKPFKATLSRSPEENNNEEIRQKRFTDVLKMQTYFSQLSQLERAMKL